MCLTYHKIRNNGFKPSWNGAKRYCYAPCGVCADCRKRYNYAWAWRLTSDFQFCVQQLGYKVGFITLTYNNESLPHFPEYLPNGFLSPVAHQPCFSRTHTKKLMDYIRKISHKEKGLTDVRFLLSSEFGEQTARPHYHLILCWNSKLATAEYMHNLIKHYWSEPLKNKHGQILRGPLGFVTPRDLAGGESKRSGQKIKPFEIGLQGDILRACFYTAKYASKSLGFLDSISHLPREYWKSLKEYFPHHRQTKGLGSCGLESLCDSEKIELLERGKTLLGDTRLFMPPLYIQNKILFCPKYVFDDNGNRLCKKECTEFYKKNFDVIQKRKIAYYDELFSQMATCEYWKRMGVSNERIFNSVYPETTDYALGASLFVRDNSTIEKIGCKLSEAYLYYYGVPAYLCFVDKRLSFISRYKWPAVTYSSMPLISLTHWENIQRFFGYLFEFCKWQKIAVEDREPSKIREYWNEVAQ